MLNDRAGDWQRIPGCHDLINGCSCERAGQYELEPKLKPPLFRRWLLT